MRNKLVILFLFFSSCSFFADAQQLLMDQGVQANNLWCFPLFENPNTYVYLPSSARIIYDTDSIPQIVFLDYISRDGELNSNRINIKNNENGASLHLLAEYYTSDIQVDMALDQLRLKLNNEKIIIQGPVDYSMTLYSLVTSVTNPITTLNEIHLLANGKNLIYENNNMLSLSFELSPESVDKLKENSKISGAPNIYLIFELRFSGLTDSYDASVEIDWNKVEQIQKFSSDNNGLLLGPEVELGLKSLFNSGAIKLTAGGATENMRPMINTAYDMLGTSMFETVYPTTHLPTLEESRNSAYSALISSYINAGGNSTKFGLHLGYKPKTTKNIGKEAITLQGRSTVNRPHYIVFNIGDFYQKHKDDSNIFRHVSPETDCMQRQLLIAPEVYLVNEFEKSIDSVTIDFRRLSEDGETNSKKILITKESFRDNQSTITLFYTYVFRRDSSQREKLRYEYKTKWYFSGGASHTSDWVKTEWSSLFLTLPFQRRRIIVETDFDLLKEQGISSLEVQVNYPFFDRKKSAHLTLYPTDRLEDGYIDITLPSDVEKVDYTIDYIMSDGTIHQRALSSDPMDSYLFILPPEE